MGVILDKLTGNPLLIDIKEADLDASLIAKINSNKNTIPAQDIAMQYFDGTRVGNEFIDKGIQGLNLDIIDNDIELTSGFPYKSAAKIKQKATSFGLIPNPNLFWFQADGTPNEIPVVSLFQNIDYANQIFTRHAAQQVDGNGVETYEPRVLDIVTYASALTGDNLTIANAYFKVPVEITTAVKWVDTVNGSDAAAGTKAAPWKTIQKANTSATENDTIYIKSGTYNEIKTASTDEYLYINKVLTFKGLGNVIIQSNSTAKVALLVQICTFERVQFDGQNSTSNVVEDTAGKLFTLNKCKISGAITNLISGGYFESYVLTNCLLIGSLVAVRVNQTAIAGLTDVNSCYVSNTILSNYRNNCVIRNCKINGNDKENTILTEKDRTLNIYGNYIKFDRKGISASAAYTSSSDVFIKYNTFIQGSLIGALDNSIAFLGVVRPIILNNTFNAITEFTSGTLGSFISVKNAEIGYNIFTSVYTAKAFTHVFCQGSNVNIHDNYSHTNSPNAMQFTIGAESSTTGTNDNAIVINNRLIGSYYNYPSIASIAHAMLFSSGINMDIRNNKISHSYIGIVAKSNQQPYISKGLQYNLINDCNIGIYIRGVSGVNVFNNTILRSNATYADVFNVAIIADENSAAAGDQFSENVIIKNNIIDVKLSVGHLIRFDAHAAANGCIAEYNTLNGGQYLLADGTNYSSLAVAQAAGKLLNCTMLNPNLDADLIPSAKVEYAVDLGTDYDDGLDVTSDFGSETVTPVIVTKQQAATWQNGAYIL